MNKWVLLLSCLLAMGSCSNHENENEACITIDLAPLLKKGEMPAVNLSDWAKSVQYIQLETNDSILIKYINRIYYCNDRFLIQHGNRVSLFNKDGKYLFDPAKQGGGPEEFATNRETRVNSKLIYIEDSPERIKTYDWDGNYKGTITLPDKNIYGFYPLPDKNVIIGHRINLDGNQPTRLYFCQDGIVIDSIPNYTTYPKPGFSMQISSEFEPLGGEKVDGFKELFNDTIYQISKEMQLNPYAIINLGDYGVKPERRYKLTIDDIKNDNLWQGKSIILSLGDVGDCFYIKEFNKERYGDLFYYDRNKQETKGVRLLISENKYELSPDNYFVPDVISNDNKYLIGWSQPENDNNPVIIMVKP